MASYTITKNQELVVNLPYDFSVQGWEVSEKIAYHSGCNPGYIKYFMDLSASEEWTFRFEILSLTSGTVNIIVDGIDGTVWDTIGFKEEVFEVSGTNTEIQFYATGTTSIRVLQVYPELESTDGRTLLFNEDADKWVGEYYFAPEFMHKFLNGFFAFNNGQLWEQNVNPIRNNFFGVQSYSSVTFICNVEFRKNKLFFNLRLDSNGAWYSPMMKTQITDQFPNGMESRLTKSNLKLIDGKLWGDILRDMTDPAFSTIVNPTERRVKALFNGRKLQGGYITIELRNDDTTEAKLSSVEVYYIEAERNF